MTHRKVLIVNIANLGYGGISSVIMNYVRKTYQDVDYGVVLCSAVEEKLVDELRSYGVKIFLPPYSRRRKPFAYSIWLKKMLKEYKYDIIHVHGSSSTMYSEIHAAKQAHVPIRVAHSHSSSCKYVTIHKVLKPFLNRELTHAIACSDSAGKWLFTKAYSILPNGIDVDKFAFSQTIRDEYRKKMGLEDKFVIGHIGYMDTEKNHMFLLRVFKKLVEVRPDARLLLIGDGRLRSEIEQYIEENQLSDVVQVLGNRTDVANLYQCMDIFVLPSLFEGLPVTLVEAQSAGLRCLVSSAVTTQANITGDVQYLSVDDENMGEWIRMLSENGDVTRNRSVFAETMGNSAFNISKSVEALLQAYQIDKK